MATIQRLTDSCLLVTNDHDATLFDPGFHTYQSGEFDLDSLGDVTKVCITHAHGDHASPEFVAWLIDRRHDIVVYSNQDVLNTFAHKGIEVSTDIPRGFSAEDVLHEMIPNGGPTLPPRRKGRGQKVSLAPGTRSHTTTPTRGKVVARVKSSPGML